jgi:CMP-N,N'-diacetyllegionaminic acid synthase
MSRILAIIPARAGSKGVPGKNLRPLAGKPLILWTIEQALAAKRLSDVVVSTDSEEIAAFARAAGALAPFLRPPELATDEAATEPAMRHALGQMEQRGDPYDAVMLLQPTSPLRLPGTIDRAIEAFNTSGADSLLGVVANHAFFWQTDPIRASYDPANRPRRQDIAPSDRRYRETGSIYLTRRDAFLEDGNRLAGNIALFEMDEREGWEVDTLTDFAVLETLMHEEQPA